MGEKLALLPHGPPHRARRTAAWLPQRVWSALALDQLAADAGKARIGVESALTGIVFADVDV